MKINFIVYSAILFTTSCATILTGTKDNISFNSTPKGAIIYKDGIELCRTPCNIPVKRDLGDVQIEFKLEGYQTRVITLDKKFNVVSVINLGNLLGWGIDAATGSVMKYDRRSYDIELSKDNRVSVIYPKKVNIDTKNNKVDVYMQ